MKLQVLNLKTNKSVATNVSDVIFAREFNKSLVHQVTTSYMTVGRQGSKAQKNRSTANGGGKKPWKQKGTGRSRAGTSRSPIWRSGGVTFAAKPKKYTKKINKKMYKGAISVIFSELIRSNSLKVINDFVIKDIKTKNVLELLKKLKIKDALFMSDSLDEKLYLSSRNLYNVGVCTIEDINPLSLIGYENVVISKDALKKIETIL
jgi:large subunit ribosomal protein L4